MPQPSSRDIKRFCEIDGWEQTKTVKKKDGDHFRYRKHLDDGGLLRTRASHSKDQIGDPGLWHHIWHEQLGLASEDQFWAALKSGKPVDRSPAAPQRPQGPSLPAHLAGPLIRQVGLTVKEVAGLSVDEAEARLAAYYESLHLSPNQRD